MDYVYWGVSSIVGSTIPKQYKIMSNQHNIFRTYIHIFDLMDTDEKKEKFIEIIRNEAGNTIIEEFKKYLFDHIPKSKIIQYL